ncbi:MAG: hypothetical protein MRJ68_01865 [Nitrospira sp.]|nr:hypothetical protein [Nitrospira sp.]
MPELSVLLAFIKAVFWTNFPAIAYGGVVPPVMASFYVWVTGKQFPLKSRIKWGLIVGVLLAIFMAWSEQYKARNILEAEVHSLRERMQIAQKTTLQSVIEISDPVIISNKKSGDGWLVYYLSNVGMAETKVILAESTIVLSEQRNQYKYPNEFILQPKRGKFELRVPIPPLTAKNMANRGKSS